MPRHEWQYSGAELSYQFSSPDYVKEYNWDKFDPFFASSADLEFQALPLEEQFRRLPKCIVCNEDNHLGHMAVEKMLLFIGEQGVHDRRYVDWCSENWAESWRVAKRFNECIEAKRYELEMQPGDEEVERIREAIEREKEEAREESERRFQERRRELQRQKELERRQREAEEQRRLIEKEAKEERRRELEVVAAKARQELANDLNKGALALRQTIARFTQKDEMVMRYECEGLGRQIGRFIRLFARRLKAHIESGSGELDWRVVQEAVKGVISVVELVYFQRNPGVNWNGSFMLDSLRAHGVREAWGDLLLKLFFESGIEGNQIVRWVRRQSGLYGRLKAVVKSMDRCGMGRTQILSIAFSF
ncbi:hypothetical protein QBC32DRAFT_336011 [Pseudoneurospora amorphoporcata]|uniref:Uncharacterized protein n=1 Tax=Pseudoneurospora amorphoporcata TaxID=241081 RepID=A0AAN6SIG3_9PEZI|nr:hypothetical protein QBC32DRAFT_336011 [Pseudoneurospora amorphoporcata]